MAFELETKESVLERLLAHIDDGIDKRQGSVVFDLLSPASMEFAQAYVALDQVLQFGFASEDMPSNFLDLRAAEFGLSRKPAVKAVGEVTFLGSEGLIIPSGTRVSTNEVLPVYFVTTQSGTVTGGSVTVAAEAETGGENGNVAQGKIVLTLGDISGITSVTNALPFDGGANIESDASLLARYFDRVRKPVTSGNANQYEQWAKEVAGVGDAKVFPLADGPGTVKVVLIDEQKTAPAQTIVDAVTTHLESVRPIGASVTVVGASETAINVSADLVIADGTTLDDAQAEFSGLLTEYLKTLAFNDPIVRYSKLASLLLDAPSILDYASLTVNGGTANVTVSADSVAVVGEVTLA